MVKELTVDEAGRIELPYEIRKRRQITPGQRLRLEEHTDGTLVLRVGRRLRELVGMLDSNGIHLTIEQINEVIESKGLEP